MYIGVIALDVGLNPARGGGWSSHGGIAYRADGQQYSLQVGSGSSSVAAYGASYTAGDIIGCAVDIDSDTITFYKNGVSQGNTTNGPSHLATNKVYGAIAYCNGGNNIMRANFGQDSTFQGTVASGGNADASGIGDFKYTVPTGFKALCTANLPTPTIKKGSDHFNTITYTGDGNQTRTLAGVGFQPDMIWHRIRTGTTQEIAVMDAVRTFDTNKVLGVDNHTAEGTWNGANSSEYGYVSSVNSDGFVVNDGTTSTNGGYVNYNSRTYVAWNWKESATAGFDIVSYTGNGTSGNTVSHSLGVAPDLIIIKRRDATASWQVFHTSLGPTKFTGIDTNYRIETSTNRWNDTAPTSSVFTLGDNTNVNGSKMLPTLNKTLLISELCTMFKEDNNNFDIVRFIDACDIDDD